MKNLCFGVLASGNLGKVCIEDLFLHHQIKFVCTDRSSQGIIEFCNKHSIEVFIGNPRTHSDINSFLDNKCIDVLFSINYLFIVGENLLNLPSLYAINFHGSLLPKYRGRTPHVWAIINNEKKIGITAHLMTKNCDEGDIIYQQEINIDQNDTGNVLLQKFGKYYPEVISKVILLVESNSLVFIKQDESKATYFTKRTPDDGEINWNWQKERIFNWVRAQANPYPGAFSFYQDNKVIINKVDFSDKGFNQMDINGQILDNSENLIVKTPNGAIILSEIECCGQINFKVGEVFRCKTLE